MTKVNERGEFKKPTKEEVSAVLNAGVKERVSEYVDKQQNVAEHIVQVLGLKEGTVLDASCGQALVDVALALECPGIDFVLADSSELALKAAEDAFAAYGLEARMQVVAGDEQDLPLEDGSFDYVISTTPGLWANKQQGLEEIHRVLAVGGRAYVTGIEWDNYRDYFGMMMQAELDKFAVNHDGKRTWIDIFKTAPDDEGDEE